MDIFHKMALTLALSLFCILSHAQRAAVQINMLDIVNLGTLNAQASFGLGRHWTATLQGRYNNWDYGSAEGGNPFQNRTRALALGARYWTWNTYSGWWLGTQARFEEYNRGGMFGKNETEEGNAVGAGLSAGFSYMLSKHWNLDFGVGGWWGVTDYRTFACPRCGRVLREGRKQFVSPSADCQVSVAFVF